MGNCQYQPSPKEEELQQATNPLQCSTQFHFMCIIGRGGFGKVWKVEQKKTKFKFAMKEMSKVKIISKKSVNSVMNERYLLSTLNHPFIVNMVSSFQDKENLYLVMDLLSGGDLRFHINKIKKFTEEQTSSFYTFYNCPKNKMLECSYFLEFFVACLILALEYLHYNSIIHRDVKPENLVLDSDGYLRLTDLGVARIWKPDNQSDTSGTPGYMAPEVMCRQTHGVAADYYAVGVIAYECMLGKRPYFGRTRKELRDQILAKQVQIKKQDIPQGWTLEAADFINKVIQRKPLNRLGLNGPEEIKDHLWLRDFPWQKLENREIIPPFIPKVKGELKYVKILLCGQDEDNFDSKQAEAKEKAENNTEINMQNTMLLRRNSIQELFQGYDFEKEPVFFQHSLNNSIMNSTSLSARHTQLSNVNN